MNIDEEVRRARLKAFLWIAAFVAFFVALTWVLTGCKSIASSVTPDDKAPGQPLDAHSVIEYDRPAWLPACDHAYKVVDRQTGQQWWLLVMHEGGKRESYVCMPIERSTNGND